MEVRKIEPTEYEEASRLILRTFDECVASSMEPAGAQVFRDYAQAEAMRSRDADGSQTFVAIEGGSLAGVLHVRGGDHISLLFVLPALQRKGIGRALMEAADRECRLATVHSSVNATGGYESFGFRASGPEEVRDGIRFVPMRRRAAGSRG
jgi:GNAT superfamily N-acetyltransferase